MDAFRKMFFFGLGAMNTTMDGAKKFFDEMVDRGEMNSDEAKKFFDDMSVKWDEDRVEFRTMVTQEVEKLREKMGLVTRAELEILKRRLDDLEKKVNGEPVEPVEPVE
ncbi:MAG: phasin family protein [Acidobacteriota bacterium]